MSNCNRELAFVQKLLDSFFIPLSFVGREQGQTLSAPWAELRRLLLPAVILRRFMSPYLKSAVHR